MKATLIKRTEVAENIFSHDFSIPEPINHNAGQYVNLVLPHDNPDSRGKERWFSVSSAPGGNSFQITTKYAWESSSTFKKALMAMKIGDSLDVSTPMGDFVMPIEKKRQMLWVAAGVGITPYLSMLKWMREHSENRYIIMFYAAKKKTELVNIESFKSLLQELVYFLDEEGKKLSSEIILEKAKSMKKPLVYLAGPEQMTEAFRDQLVELGFNREDIVGDYFDGY